MSDTWMQNSDLNDIVITSSVSILFDKKNISDLLYWLKVMYLT